MGFNLFEKNNEFYLAFSVSHSAVVYEKPDKPASGTDFLRQKAEDLVGKKISENELQLSNVDT